MHPRCDMTVLNAHYDGKRLVLDDPIPSDLPVNAPLRLTVETQQPQANAFEEILKFAAEGGMPADFSENHDKYIRNATKR